jgi:CRP-like cAMP-binding protein
VIRITFKSRQNGQFTGHCDLEHRGREIIMALLERTSMSSIAPATAIASSLTDPAETRAALAVFPLFAGADQRTLDLLVRSANLRRANADEEILSRDDKAGDVYFVLKGEVRIVNYSQTGREVAYAIVPAGGYFGELSAIDGRAGG